MRGLWIVLGVAAVSIATAARADRIVFRNGSVLDGIVESETATKVVFTMGAGAMTFPKSQIRRIERARPEENAAVREQSRRQNFLHPDHVPPGQEALAAALRSLLERRNAAAAEAAAAAEEARAAAAARQAIETLEAEHVAANALLRATSPEADVPAYNALVARVNALGAGLTVKQDELRRQTEAQQKRPRTVASYYAALQRGDALLAGQLAKAPSGTPATREFLERAQSRLQGLHAEFRALPVPLATGQKSNLASVTVNGRHTGRFIVDTGADVVTLGHAFAAAAGIRTNGMAAVRIRVADGREADARATVLDSVRTGEAEAARVAAVVLPGEIGPGIDGLLGMTFLDRFLVEVDGRSGRLALVRFDPAR